MDAAELDRFIDRAKSLTKDRNAEASRIFGLGDHRRYHLDLEANSLTFFDESDSPAVDARIVPVGSLASASQSWLWSWENASIPKAATEPMDAIRRFGAQHDVQALQQTFAPCDEALAWALAAVSLALLDAQAVYRIEQRTSQLFLLLFDIRRPSDEKPR